MLDNGASARIAADILTVVRSGVFHGIWMVYLFIASACNPMQRSADVSPEAAEEFAFVSEIKHAKHFTIQHHGSWKRIVVIDPWRGDTLGDYALVRSMDSVVADSLPSSCTVVGVPVKTVACGSCTHLGALVLLGERDRITGVTSGNQIWDTILLQRFKDGKLTEIGRQMNTYIEPIIALAPALLMKSGYDKVRNEDARFREAGLPIAYNIEWTEHDLLSRAEWIKFTAAFVCRERTADSLFEKIEVDYNEALRLAQSVDKRPKVLFGIDQKGAWNITGSESYVAKMLHDAGAVFVANGLKGDIPLSFEKVLEVHADDDVWLNWMHLGISSRKLLGQRNERYRLFKAFQTGEVYNHDKRLNAAGGNDFWESGVSRPDILLKDLVWIFHPHLLPGYESVYWRKLPAE